MSQDFVYTGQTTKNKFPLLKNPSLADLQAQTGTVGPTKANAKSAQDFSKLNTDLNNTTAGVYQGPDGSTTTGNVTVLSDGSTGLSWGDVASGVQGLAGLANAWTGYKALGLAEDQFEFNKGLASKNYANAAKAHNTNLLSSVEVGNKLAGTNITEEQKQASLAKANANKVSETL